MTASSVRAFWYAGGGVDVCQGTSESGVAGHSTATLVFEIESRDSDEHALHQKRPSRRSRVTARHLATLLACTLPADELERFARRLDQQVGTASTDAPDDKAALIARLTGGESYTAAECAALEAWALLARSQDRRDLLAGALKTSDVARLLGRSRQAVHDRVKAGTLLAIDDGGELRYPSWQFDPDGERGVVAGLPDALAALWVEPLSKARWLTRPNALFEGRTPLQLLKDGEKQRVVAAARGVSVDA